MREQLCAIAKHAGDAIMAIYQAQEPATVMQKSDDSPVTEADIAAHHVIKTGLEKLDASIVQLSEEAPPAWQTRKSWSRYWLIDPLDGTKEFINRNGEFTVNIALIEAGKPVIGVVYAPVNDVLYLGYYGKAYKIEKGISRMITVREATVPLVVISRSHQDAELTAYLNTLGDHHTVAIGSSLKFCLIAEGIAQLYPRFGATHIWDTAAGHAVALAAGAKVVDWHGNELDYSMRESLLNPGFCVSLSKCSGFV